MDDPSTTRPGPSVPVPVPEPPGPDLIPEPEPGPDPQAPDIEPSPDPQIHRTPDRQNFRLRIRSRLATNGSKPNLPLEDALQLVDVRRAGSPKFEPAAVRRLAARPFTI